MPCASLAESTMPGSHRTVSGLVTLSCQRLAHRLLVKDFPAELSRQVPGEVRENFVTTVISQWCALQKSANGWERDDVAISESRVNASSWAG